MTEVIAGRNPVREVLRAGRRKVHKIMVARGSAEKGTLGEILKSAQRAGLPVERVPKSELGTLAGRSHAVAAVVDPYPYVELADVLDLAAERGEDPLILILDSLQDPQNLGTLLRTAEALGAHGAVLPYRGGVGVTPAVVAASAGACEHMLVVGANLAQAMANLKAAGVWIVGLDVAGAVGAQDPARLRGPLAVVVGNEGRGMRRLVRQLCDFRITLPRRGVVESMNAAVAGSIVLYEAYQARRDRA
ncbi:MAG TPA: 23S rRNA (guanosine(2251)-2'-O)-methyltransferase RlmB [Anaerolineales bacterium]|nr:23S rRNA (guanosine(2251)-2'-O)-methyltransferase RlmB [Anaerolineales bacterium]